MVGKQEYYKISLDLLFFYSYDITLSGIIGDIVLEWLELHENDLIVSDNQILNLCNKITMINFYHH